ncbi:MAG: hypothetical protein JSR54_07455 [Proteobacteria bacterium]|nr:hypothetical protein [Pseudomonadota bacterium]
MAYPFPAEAIFRPDELLLLDYWLNVGIHAEFGSGFRDSVDRRLQTPEYSAAAQRLGFSGDARRGFHRLQAAAAHCLLVPAWDRLPRWRVGSQGHIRIARQNLNPRYRPRRKIETAPIHLVTIDRGATPVGLVDHVAYHATWVPGYECRVVTVSGETAQEAGYLDFAIACIEANGDWRRTAKRAVLSDWQRLAGQGALRWKEMVAGGLISESEAIELANEAWRLPARSVPVRSTGRGRGRSAERASPAAPTSGPPAPVAPAE